MNHLASQVHWKPSLYCDNSPEKVCRIIDRFVMLLLLLLLLLVGNGHSHSRTHTTLLESAQHSGDSEIEANKIIATLIEVNDANFKTTLFGLRQHRSIDRAQLSLNAPSVRHNTQHKECIAQYNDSKRHGTKQRVGRLLQHPIRRLKTHELVWSVVGKFFGAYLHTSGRSQAACCQLAG